MGLESTEFWLEECLNFINLHPFNTPPTPHTFIFISLGSGEGGLPFLKGVVKSN